MESKKIETNVTTELARERTREAADRTLMAWIRTSLAMIGFGFSINKVVDVLQAGQAATPFHTTLLFALSFITLGTLGLLGAISEYLGVMKRLQRLDFEYTTPTHLTLVVAILLACIGLFSFIAVLMVR